MSDFSLNAPAHSPACSAGKLADDDEVAMRARGARAADHQPQGDPLECENPDVGPQQFVGLLVMSGHEPAGARSGRQQIGQNADLHGDRGLRPAQIQRSLGLKGFGTPGDPGLLELGKGPQPSLPHRAARPCAGGFCHHEFIRSGTPFPVFGGLLATPRGAVQ